MPSQSPITWRHVIPNKILAQLLDFLSTKTGKKTEHILRLVCHRQPSKKKNQTQMSESAAVAHKKPQLQLTCLKGAKTWKCIGTVCQKARQIICLFTVINENFCSSKSSKRYFDSYIQWSDLIFCHFQAMCEHHVRTKLH